MDRDAGAWQVVPATPAQIEAAARDARRMVGRRALLAAGVAIVPLPALDLATSVGVLVKLLPDIHPASVALSAPMPRKLACTVVSFEFLIRRPLPPLPLITL